MYKSIEYNTKNCTWCGQPLQRLRVEEKYCDVFFSSLPCAVCSGFPRHVIPIPPAVQSARMSYTDALVNSAGPAVRTVEILRYSGHDGKITWILPKESKPEPENKPVPTKLDVLATAKERGELTMLEVMALSFPDAVLKNHGFIPAMTRDAMVYVKTLDRTREQLGYSPGAEALATAEKINDLGSYGGIDIQTSPWVPRDRAYFVPVAVETMRKAEAIHNCLDEAGKKEFLDAVQKKISNADEYLRKAIDLNIPLNKARMDAANAELERIIEKQRIKLAEAQWGPTDRWWPERANESGPGIEKLKLPPARPTLDMSDWACDYDNLPDAD